ncbi:MAG: sulfate transporter family protein [Xanthobacteraceae bacterium]
MIEDVIQSFAQTFSPALRRILLKSVALAILLLLVLGVILQTLIAQMASLPQPFEMALAIATGLGMIAGAIYLMGPISSLIAALFLDEVAERVERTSFPADPVGRPLPIAQSLVLSVKFFGLILLVNFIALLLLLIPGINLIAFFVANGYLLGREYFELAAMRYRPMEEARTLRRENSVRVFLAGLAIAGVVVVPFLNLITPIFATALMVRVHKRLSPTRELIEPAAR